MSSKQKKSTQTLSVKTLICDYGFKIKAIKDKKHIEKLFLFKNKGSNFWSANIE